MSETTKSHLTTARAISTSAVAVSAGLVRGVSYVATTLGKQLSGAVAQTEYGKQWNAAGKLSKKQTTSKFVKINGSCFCLRLQLLLLLEEACVKSARQV